MTMPDSNNPDHPRHLDFSLHFDPAKKVPEPSRSESERRRIDEFGVIGSAALKSVGYFSSKMTLHTAKLPANPAVTTVLVVEDDAGTATVILKVLQSAGYLTRHARDKGEIAGEFKREPLPDIVLLDVLLPQNYGFDILNRMRQHPRLKSIPVIMLTTLGETEDIVKGLTLGADGYLTKPAMPSTLLKALRSLTAD
jgi:two-component system OmpR family response regulator